MTESTSKYNVGETRKHHILTLRADGTMHLNEIDLPATTPVPIVSATFANYVDLLCAVALLNGLADTLRSAVAVSNSNEPDGDGAGLAN